MRIAISNIAWDPDLDDEVAQILASYGVDAIDVAPGKYFPHAANVSSEDIVKVRDTWAHRGMSITGMQALLFGTTGLNLFGPPEVQHEMLQHLNSMCRIGAGLGATKLVFGSPKNRDRTTLSDDEATKLAIPFFRRLGDIAASHAVTICLEPNPVRYGANFMTTSDETALMVQEVAHPAIKMQFDTGAVTINGEDPSSVLKKYGHLVGHVHISEPDLVPLGDGATNHEEIAKALSIHLPDHTLTIEMLSPKKEGTMEAIERAVALATTVYRTN